MKRSPSPSLVGRSSPLWAAVEKGLQQELGTRAREIVGALRPYEAEPTTLRLGAPRGRLGPWLRDGTLLRLEGLVQALSGNAYELVVIPFADPEPGEHDPTQRLERFVAGRGNREALKAVRSVLDESRPEPLLLSGPSGTGKSHLLCAATRALKTRFPSASVLHTSAEALFPEIVEAILAGTLESLRHRLASCDALLIDNLHALADRDTTQTEIAAVLGDLRDRAVPILFATEQPPELLSEMGQDLRRALEGVRSMALDPPDWETRTAIVLDRARAWGVQLTANVAGSLASGIGTNLAQLDRVITRAMLLRRDQDLDLEHVRRALAAGPVFSGIPAPEIVLEVISRHYGLRVRDLRGPRRTAMHTASRHLAAYVLRTRCGLSFPKIGRCIGRHHSTAIHGVRKIERSLSEDGSLASLLGLVEKELSLRSEKDN